jgi:hypothetical protein
MSGIYLVSFVLDATRLFQVRPFGVEFMLSIFKKGDY